MRIAINLNRVTTSYQGMLALLRRLVNSSDLESLLTRALEGALELVPGVQAGSALLREGEHYRFVAVRGHAIDLPGYRVSLGDELRWYGGSLEDALMARPRVNQVRPELSALSELHRAVLGHIRHVLSVPVPFEGRVEAWIYLDCAEASPPPAEALTLAQELAQSLGVVLQGLRDRQQIQQRLAHEEALSRTLAHLSEFQDAESLWLGLPHLAQEVFPDSQVAVLRLEQDTLVVSTQANWQWEDGVGTRVPRGAGMAWAALESRQVQVVRLDDPRLFQPYGFNPLPSDWYGAFVPLFGSEGQGVGALVLWVESLLLPEQKAIAELLGRGVGQVLARLEAQAAQQYELVRTQTRLEREERLARALAVLSTFREANLLWEALPHLVAEMLGEERAAVLRREGDEMVMVAAANWKEPLGQRIPQGLGMCWQAVEARGVQMVSLDDPRVFSFPGFENHPEQYAAYVPLFDSKNEILGVLSVYSVRAFMPEDRSLLEAFGRGVGQVLGRLEAQLAQQRELLRLQSLVKASHLITPARSTQEVLQLTVREALEQTGAASCLITLYHPHEDELEVVAASGHMAPQALGKRVKRGSGLAWRVLAERVPLYLDDVSSEPSAIYTSGVRVKAAYLGVPLSDPEGRVVGVLSVDTAGAGGEIAPQDRYSLEALARVAGVSISRLRALEHAYQQTDNYRALVQMSADMELLSEPTDIARRALETLIRLTDLEAGILYQLQSVSDSPGLGRVIYLEPTVRVGEGAKHLSPLFDRLPIRISEELETANLWHGRPLITPDYQIWPQGIPEYKATGLRTTISVPLHRGSELYGVLSLASWAQVVEVGEETMALLEAAARRVERALERVSHLEEITQTREAALRSLGLGLELRDLETKGHTDRVVALTSALGERMKFSDPEGLRMGAYLHDLGKLAIPDSILLKPGTLTDREWRTMQSHCDIGYEMLGNLSFLPQTARNVVRYHHERMDGSGYPFGLMGDEIPLEARIFAAVDVYDALLQSRPYKPAWPLREVCFELESQAGRTLDAGVVRELLALIRSGVRVQ